MTNFDDPKPLSKAKRSKASRRRGSNPNEPINRATADTPGMQRPGRRLTYRNLRGEERVEMLETVHELSAAGATIHEIAQAFQVSQNTVLTWAYNDAGFAAALTPVDAAMIDRVERSLYHKAVGYSFPAEKIHINAEGVVTRVRYMEHVPPDNGAMVFLLKNRRPDKWRDKFEHDVSGKVDVNADNVDPRKLAMAVIDLLRDARQDDTPQIEHEPTETEDDDE